MLSFFISGFFECNDDLICEKRIKCKASTYPICKDHQCRCSYPNKSIIAGVQDQRNLG
jgi:hypothetical protein